MGRYSVYRQGAGDPRGGEGLCHINYSGWYAGAAEGEDALADEGAAERAVQAAVQIIKS